MCLGALRGEHSLKVARSARAMQRLPLCPSTKVPPTMPPPPLPHNSKQASKQASTQRLATLFHFSLNTGSRSCAHLPKPSATLSSHHSKFAFSLLVSNRSNREHYNTHLLSPPPPPVLFHANPSGLSNDLITHKRDLVPGPGEHRRRALVGRALFFNPSGGVRIHRTIRHPRDYLQFFGNTDPILPSHT